MSKIICDICGTSYPETAKQCPICGSVRPGDAQRVTNEVKSDGNVSTGYTYVKGGRFSKSNVKKRTKSGDNNKKNVSQERNDEDSKANRGLVATAIVLLLAIIGVVIYIAIRFFAPISDPSTGNTENLGSNIDLSCKDITLDTYTILLDQAGAAQLLNVKTTPEKPSDPVTFSSDNEAVVTVNDKGKITAVAEGTAKITVICGSVSKECVVTVQFANQETTDNTTGPEETTIPSDTTVPEESTQPTEELRLNRKEFTLSYKGETWDLYTGSIPRNQITWSIGDTSVATVENGKVVAVGNGYTYVYAEYNGQKVSCQVVCSFKEGSGVIGNGGVSEDGGGSAAKTGVIANVSKDANVRSTPSLEDKYKVGTIALGTKVTIYEKKDAAGYTWYRIGENRWVASDYVNLD